MNLEWDQYFMRVAYLVASKSHDTTQIGAVLVKNKAVISTGYNGFPIGMNYLPELMDRPEKYKYYEHAERNAIFLAARNGHTVLGSHLYTFGIPCCDCARACIQAGVTEIIVHKQWPRNGMNSIRDHWSESIEASKRMFDMCGIIYRMIDADLGYRVKLNGENIEV